MNHRDRILKVLNGETPDRVAWFGDLDYWYSAAIRQQILSDKYKGDGYFKLNPDLGLGFYLQGFFPFHSHSDVTFHEKTVNGQIVKTMVTPKGELHEVTQYLPTSFSSGYVKHFVETADDLPAFRHYIETMRFTPAYEEAVRRKAIIGDNGVVLCYTPRSPFMQLVTTYIGVVNLVYLLADAPDEMAELFALMESKYDQAAELTVASPAECIMIPENLSSEVVGERNYLKYMRGYESKWIHGIRQAGKHSFIHMDGTLKGLLKLVAETGFDVIEAATPVPSGDMTMLEIADAITTDTIIWGGLPGVIFTPCFAEDAFVEHVKYVLSIMRKKPKFVLGVADQVPPDALLERVGRVAELCETYGRYE